MNTEHGWEQEEGMFDNLERASRANEIEFSVPSRVQIPAAATANTEEIARRFAEMPPDLEDDELEFACRLA